MLKTVLVAGGACALVAGAAVAGNASRPASEPTPAVSAATTSVTDASLASAVLSADAGGTTPNTTAAQALAAHRDRLCARVPTAIIRTQNLEKRLAADASTKGSLAFLQARIDAAEAAHNDQLVTVLKNRLTYRKELAAFLPHRLELLQTAKSTVCAATPSATPSS